MCWFHVYGFAINFYLEKDVHVIILNFFTSYPKTVNRRTNRKMFGNTKLPGPFILFCIKSIHRVLKNSFCLKFTLLSQLLGEM